MHDATNARAIGASTLRERRFVDCLVGLATLDGRGILRAAREPDENGYAEGEQGGENELDSVVGPEIVATGEDESAPIGQ